MFFLRHVLPSCNMYMDSCTKLTALFLQGTNVHITKCFPTEKDLIQYISGLFAVRTAMLLHHFIQVAYSSKLEILDATRKTQFLYSFLDDATLLLATLILLFICKAYHFLHGFDLFDLTGF